MPRALIADDDPVVQHILGAILEAAGYEINSVKSGTECLDLLKAELSSDNLPDVVFLDVQLEDLSGIEVLSELRELSSEKPPVIMLSANSRDEVFTGSDLLAPDYFLEKPFVAETVSQALKAVLS